MVGEDLSHLSWVAGLGFENGAKTIVKSHPLRLRQRSICSVPHEQVPKTHLISWAVSARHQSFAPKGFKGRLRVGTSDKACNLFHLEALADDAGGLKDRLLRIRQSIEASREHRVNAFGHSDLFDVSRSTPACTIAHQQPVV